MFFGKLFAGILVSFFQCILILAVGQGYYDMMMRGDSYLYLSLLFLTALVGLSMGLFFSVIAKTKEQAVQLVPFAILVLIVLSGGVVPLREMPSPLKEIATNLPLTLSYESLEEVMLLGRSIQDIFSNLIKLVIWLILFLIFGLAKFTMEKR
jgi:ABC-2 type transport system permease protein